MGKGRTGDREQIGESANQQIGKSASQQIDDASDGFSGEDALRNTQYVMRLFRTYKDGQARFNAYLEDYAAVALGLLGLYQATFEAALVEVGCRAG